MTYIRNSSGDLVYDQNTGTYSPAVYNVISIKRTAFLKYGYVIPFINSIDMNNVPFVNNTMCGTFYSSGNAALTTVTNINNNTVNMVNTFYNCQNLTTIDRFPDSVTDISGCFESCKSLTSVPSIPNSVTCMNYTFAGCTNLTGYFYIYSNNVTNATNCFANTTKIKEVYIPFTYSNNAYTQTYNSFIAAGYDENGTKEGVYLIDSKLYKLNVDGFTYTSDIHNNVVLETYTGEATTITLPNLEEN